MDPTLEIVIGGGFLIWLTGYGAGIIFRHVRQVFEKASRP